MLLSGLLLKSSDQHSNLGGLIPDFISYSIFFFKTGQSPLKKIQFLPVVFQFYIPNQKYCTYANELGIASTCL